jgi:hypothetical protein
VTATTTERLREQLAPTAAELKDSAAQYAVAAKDWTVPRVEAAREQLGPAIEQAVEKLGPAIEQAKERLAEDVAPKVAAAVTAALVASEPVREEAKARGGAALAALKGDLVVPEPARGHRKGRVFMWVLLVGGATAATWAVVRHRRSSDPWALHETTYAPPGPVASDAAGAGPDEAMADTVAANVDAPATTPNGGSAES